MEVTFHQQSATPMEVTFNQQSATTMEDFFEYLKDIYDEDHWKIYAKIMADPDLPGVLIEVPTSQEPHDIVYQQDPPSLSIIVVFKDTTKSVRANLNDTVADLKRKMEKDLGISTPKQVLSFKSTVLQDDQSIFSIPGIANESHIELTICDDDTAEWSSNKRVKLIHGSLEIVADNLDDLKREISERLVLLSNGKELHSNADYKAVFRSGNAKLELKFSTLLTAPATTHVVDPTFTDVSASTTLHASSSVAAAKQPLKLGGQDVENDPANVSIFVELNGGMLTFVQVKKSHKISVLRDILAEAQNKHPTLAGLIPKHYLFTKEGHMIMEDISFLRNSVKHKDTIRIVSQPCKVGPPKNDGKLIKILVSKRTSIITNKMVIEIMASKTAGDLKEELAKQRRLKELGFTIPTYYSFWLFHEQATTGHLFQLVDMTSLSLQRVQEGDTVFVVPKDPLKLKVKSRWTGMTIHVLQMKATEAVRKLREILQGIRDKAFPLPSEPYDFEYNGERIMDEGKPLYWHHIVGDDELMIDIVPSLL